MKYFSGTLNPEQNKARYRELVKMFHPDKGGNEAIFQEIQAEYEMLTSGKAHEPKRRIKRKSQPRKTVKPKKVFRGRELTIEEREYLKTKADQFLNAILRKIQKS